MTVVNLLDTLLNSVLKVAGTVFALYYIFYTFSCMTKNKKVIKSIAYLSVFIAIFTLVTKC